MNKPIEIIFRKRDQIEKHLLLKQTEKSLEKKHHF